MNANQNGDQNRETRNQLRERLNVVGDDLTGDQLKVASLLLDLPRVATPADFDARLKARLATAKAEDLEFAGVTRLLADLPQVTAPADFDFRVRARIANARAEQQSVSWWSWLNIRNFSLVQASAALLVVAFVASGVTYKLLHTSPANPIGVGSSIASVKNSVAVEEGMAAPRVEERSPAPVEGKLAISNPMRPRASSFAPVVNRTRELAAAPAPVDPEPASQIADSGTVMIKHAGNGSARMVSLVSYGLQSAVVHPNVAKAAREDVATQIF